MKEYLAPLLFSLSIGTLIANFWWHHVQREKLKKSFRRVIDLNRSNLDTATLDHLDKLTKGRL